MKDDGKVSPLDYLENPELVKMLLSIPRKILHHHEVEGLPQIILHELADKLNLKRASYLIDNPDFDCLKGVAGFCCNQKNTPDHDAWHDPHNFKKHIEQAEFNADMQKFLHASVKKKIGDYANKEDLIALGKNFGMENPQVYTWNMRHGNHGILIFETSDNHASVNNDLIDHATALLGLCPL